MSNRSSYDKDTVESLAFIFFVGSSAIAIFTSNAAFALMTFISGLIFAGLLISDMLE